MVALAVVVVHEAADGRPQVVRADLHHQRHLALQRALQPLDLADGLRIVRCGAQVPEPSAAVLGSLSAKTTEKGALVAMMRARR